LALIDRHALFPKDGGVSFIIQHGAVEHQVCGGIPPATFLHASTVDLWQVHDL
jgi:hypothetical protein